MTRAEYTQKFGTPPPVPATAPVEPVAPVSTYVSPGSKESQQPRETAFGNQVNARADKVGQILTNKTPAGKTNLFEKALGVVGQGVGVASDLTGDVLEAGLHGANRATGGIAGILGDKAVQAVTQSPLGVKGVNALKQGADAWSQFESQHPRAAQDLSAIPSIANLVTTFYTGGAGKSGAEVIGQVFKKGVENVAENSAKKGVEKALAEATSRVTPAYDAARAGDKLKMQAQNVNGKPRVNEGGLFTGRTVNSTSLEKEAGKELLTVPGYNSKLTHLQTENLVRPEIAARGKALEASIGKEKILVPKKQVLSIVRDAVNEVPETSLLLQKSDPAIFNYVRVAKNAAQANDGTLSGVLKVRKNLDQAYANARGQLAYDSDKLSALDEVHQAGRNALTKFLIDNAKNVDVKKALRSQWNLYRALDEISPKAAKEGGSKAQRLINAAKAHPLVTGTALVGTGIGIAKGTGL